MHSFITGALLPFMMFVAAGAGMLLLLAVLRLFLNASGKHCFGNDALRSVRGVPLVTRKKFRENILRTFRKEFPFVGSRWGYVERRWTVYFLFGRIPVRFTQHMVELDTNTMIRVMTVNFKLHKPAHTLH